MIETLICECVIGSTRLRLYENHIQATLPFSVSELASGLLCRDDFATIDTATQAYLDRRRELRSNRGF